ncbi:MAG: vitamin K epoxide reductase family protein [Thermoplasmata archaeon]|nr:vitamin K epoxide reductase family protein [Thermoplasmata archaeon]
MRAETLHAIVLLALVGGLGLSIFAAYETLYPSAQSVCNINPFFSCSKVDSSAYSKTLGVPDWAIGIAGFVLLLALDVPLYRTWRRDLLLGLTLVSVFGVVISAYFAYVELAIIRAFCPVCLSAYLANLVALLGALALVLQGRSTVEPEERSDAQRDSVPAESAGSR